MLGHSLFFSKTGFWLSYCQISTDLDKISHTPIVVRNILVGRLRPRSARAAPGQTRTTMFFVILVTHRKSYIEKKNLFITNKHTSQTSD